jgi:hypothetical protein
VGSSAISFSIFANRSFRLEAQKLVPTFGLRKKLGSINLKKPKVGSQKLGSSFQKSDTEKRSSNLQPDFQKLRKRLKGCLCFYQSALQTSTSSSQIWSAAEYQLLLQAGW